MKAPDRQFIDQMKPIIKRIPGTQRLNKIRHNIIQLRGISRLIKENRIVVFPPYARMGSDASLSRAMAREVVEEWLDLYGVIHLRRATVDAIHAPAGAVVLSAPQALLKLPSSHEAYLKNVERETRRLIRLADKEGYVFKEFVWDDYLDDIYEINTSKEMRQSVPMHGWYTESVQPRRHSKEELLCRKYYGAFKDRKLCAYLHYLICGDFAVAKHFMGHAQHLRYGIMNGLMSCTVREGIADSQIRWFHYGVCDASSLSSFKKHAGFQAYAVLIDPEGDQELLKCSERRANSWNIWR